MKLKGKILLVCLLPILYIGISVLAVTATKVRSDITNEKIQWLKSMSYSTQEIMNGIAEGVYSEKDGQIFKGDSYNISQAQQVFNNLKQNTGMDITFFYGETRALTTLADENGNYNAGAEPTQEIIDRVLVNGEVYTSKNTDIQGTPYYACYIPIKQPTGETVGMLFSGLKKSESEAGISKLLLIMLLTILICAAVGVTMAILAAGSIAKAIKNSTRSLVSMASGNIEVEINACDLSRKDEIGEISRSAESLKHNLQNSIHGIMDICLELTDSSNHLEEMAVKTASTTEQVGRAIYDIANGASSQAAETQQASDDVLHMGLLIEETSEEVATLNRKAGQMSQLSEEAGQILSRLKTVTEEAREAVEVIHIQTNTTNESAVKIKEATEIITSIADETNLLSLNASIEAARAGEQGRGFAVVASQIQKLAEQSNESARVITEIIKSLIDDSNQAVDTMNHVSNIITQQVEQVTATGDIFGTVREGIQESIKSVYNIKSKTESLDSSRNSVVTSVQNLSAIAEENAAGTEETSAATEEVSTSITKVADLSEKLMELAERLEKEVKIFKIDM